MNRRRLPIGQANEQLEGGSRPKPAVEAPIGAGRRQPEGPPAPANGADGRAVQAERLARSTFEMARKAMEDAQRRVRDILGASSPAFENRAPDRSVEAALGLLARDVSFYVDHAAEIDARVEAAPAGPDRAEFVGARDLLLREALLAPVPEGGYRIQATSWPPGSPGVDFTGYERQALAQFHLVLLTRVLVPGLLVGRPTQNYVDPRLAKPEPWRDLYFCDAQGHLAEHRRVPVR